MDEIINKRETSAIIKELRMRLCLHDLEFYHVESSYISCEDDICWFDSTKPYTKTRIA